MSKIIEVKVPDIGSFKDVEIIEVLVDAGFQIEVEDSLITIESDKSSMEIPSPVAGTIKQMLVKVGDRVSEGSALLMLEIEETPHPPAPSPSGVEGEQEVASSSQFPSPLEGEGLGVRGSSS